MRLQAINQRSCEILNTDCWIAGQRREEHEARWWNTTWEEVNSKTRNEWEEGGGNRNGNHQGTRGKQPKESLIG